MPNYSASVLINNYDPAGLYSTILFYDSNELEGTSVTLSDYDIVISEMESTLNGTAWFNLVTYDNGSARLYLYWNDPDSAPIMTGLINDDTSESINFAWSETATCSGCFSVEWNQCETEYELQLGVEPASEYEYALRHDQTGERYTQTLTADAQGVVTWDATVLPELYINGQVFVLTATDGGESVGFIYNGSEYSCAQIKVVSSTDTTPEP